ncbi:PAS domain-containing protein [Streptomyces radicis]|uniref:PAS domain-containing protein n=1 Tax=Streptomyces radicis TaxID=1750517 RepID=A0A3A9W5A2_9ACTN|nr:PAS domain-containing protein [Streptomyces radicis]RKN04434.1 PAS domain-containing protein [Streptomyces radicis]RKN15202.1 PAS domain-containing protein [Streptomyces radicis]
MAPPERTGRDTTHAPLPAVAVIDADGVVTGWTAAAERLLGHPADAVVRRHGTALLAPNARTLAAAPPGRNGPGRGTRGPASPRPATATATAFPRHLRISPPRRVGGTEWLVSATAVPETRGGNAVAEAFLESLLHRAPVMSSLWDRELRAVRLNDAASRETDGARPVAGAAARHVHR